MQFFYGFFFRHPKSPTTVAKLVNGFLNAKKDETREELRVLMKNGVRFSVITDEWTSGLGPRYLNVILRGADQIFNIGLIRCTGSLTADNISSLMSKRMEDFGVALSSAVALSSDGCSVMKKVGPSLSFSFSLSLSLSL